MIKAILFDLDQTLIDFLRMKKMSCQEAMNSMVDAGLDIEPSKAMKILFNLYEKYGIEDHTIFQKFLKKVKGEVDPRILSYGILGYRRVKTGFLWPYPGAKRTLVGLKEKGLKLAIVSDAPLMKAWMRLCSMRLDDFFDVVVTFDDTKKYKPHKLPFEAAIKRLDVRADECLMIGDHPGRDIKGAKEMGMKTCLAKYGQVFKLKGVKPDYTIKKIQDLLKIV